MTSESQEYCLIIGTQRGGTSTLFETLSNCSNIASSSKKELHYFDNPKSFMPSLAAYSGKFTGVGVRMEASPSYLYIPIVPKRIKAMLSQARFIVLLRNPIDRAFSHFALVQRFRSDADIRRSLTFEDALKLEDTETVKSFHGLLYYSYLSRGRYIEQFQNWFSYFSRDRFLIIKSEDYFSSPECEVLKCLSFALGEEPVTPEITLVNRFSTMSPVHTVKDYGSIGEELRRKLQTYFQPYNEQLYTLLGRDFKWD